MTILPVAGSPVLIAPVDPHHPASGHVMQLFGIHLAELIQMGKVSRWIKNDHLFRQITAPQPLS